MGGIFSLHKSKRSKIWRVPDLTAAEYAEEAIECIRLNDCLKYPSYELLRPMGFSRRVTKKPDHKCKAGCKYEFFGYKEDDGIRDFVHVSFIAEPINSNSKRFGVPQVLIFAELVDLGFQCFELSFHWVTSNLRDPKITFGCGICSSLRRLPHPPATANGFAFARHDYKSLDPASTQKLIDSFKCRALLFKERGWKKIEQSPGSDGYDCAWPADRISLWWESYDIFSPELLEREYAELALKYINEEEDVEFELEKTVGVGGDMVLRRYFEYWCHVSFTARPKTDDDVSRHVLFFAEMLNDGDQEMRVVNYYRLDPEKVTYGCSICPRCDERFPHPSVERFTTGEFHLRRF
ncbi:hypothetical protein M5689_002203 [Euphorbia peplus]|nr:hypothetical protein M5689_002203 [Euphorbia peplus]